MTNITISDEARECASDLLCVTAKSYSPDATKRGIYEHRIQLLLNQRDEEIRELRKDKERLDWLQSNMQGVEMLAGEFRVYKGKQIGPSMDVRDKYIRQSINAAMSKETKGGGDGN